MPTTATTAIRQHATLDDARNWGSAWTSADLEFLEACADIPADELARALGRTLYAVYAAREALAKGTLGNGPGRRQAAPQDRTPVCAACWLQHAGDCA